jgi:hypothetical protein
VYVNEVRKTRKNVFSSTFSFSFFQIRERLFCLSCLFFLYILFPSSILVLFACIGGYWKFGMRTIGNVLSVAAVSTRFIFLLAFHRYSRVTVYIPYTQLFVFFSLVCHLYSITVPNIHIYKNALHIIKSTLNSMTSHRQYINHSILNNVIRIFMR